MHLNAVYQCGWFDAIVCLSMYPDRFQTHTLSSTNSFAYSDCHFSIYKSTTGLPISKPSDHPIPLLILAMHPFPPKTTKSTATILMSHIPKRIYK